MSKRKKLELIGDVVTVIATYIDRWTYTKCCLVSKEWYEIFKVFNKSFHYYYVYWYNPAGGAPRNDYFLCNSIEEALFAVKEDLYRGDGLWFFSFQDSITLHKVPNDRKKKEESVDLYPFITVKIPSKFGDLPICYNQRKTDKYGFSHRAVDSEIWIDEKEEELERYMEDLFVMDDWEEDVMRDKITVDIDLNGVVKKMGGKYLGALKNTFDVLKAKRVPRVCCGDDDQDDSVTKVTLDQGYSGIVISYGKISGYY